MEIIKIIDNIIATTAVRWALLIATIALTGLTIYQSITLRLKDSRIQALAGDNAVISASLQLQNDMVEKQGQDMERLLKRIQDINAEANRQLARNREKLRAVQAKILTGPCDNMVIDVLTDVRADVRADNEKTDNN